MKGVLLPALLAGATAIAAAQQASVDGRWKVSSNIAGNASELSCTFMQKQAELTGTCDSDQGPLALTGTTDGKKVTWQFNVMWEGEALTLVYTGSLESAAKIVGTVIVQPIEVTGDFTATSSK